MPSVQPSPRVGATGHATALPLRELASLVGEKVAEFVIDLRNPSSAVAFGSILFIVIAGLLMILNADPNRIRAHAPPPPTKVQIQQAQETAMRFSTTPPNERGQLPASK
jgi:hypothetical protein